MDEVKIDGIEPDPAALRQRKPWHAPKVIESCIEGTAGLNSTSNAEAAPHASSNGPS
jgi:hypothetical protein